MKSLRTHSADIKMEFAMYFIHCTTYIANYIVKDGLRENRASKINYGKVDLHIIKWLY